MDMNTDSLSTIWHRQPVPEAIAQEELLARIARVRRKAYWRHGRMVLLLIGTLVYMNVLLSYVPAFMLSTKIGVALIDLAILLYVAASSDLIFLWMRPSGKDVTVSDHLQEMVKLKQRQQFLFGRFYSIYFLLLLAGLTLYIIEYTLRMRLYLAVTTWVLAGAWTVIFWFWVRPKQIRRHMDKVDASIAELRRLAGQLHVSS